MLFPLSLFRRQLKYHLRETILKQDLKYLHFFLPRQVTLLHAPFYCVHITYNPKLTYLSVSWPSLLEYNGQEQGGCMSWSPNSSRIWNTELHTVGTQ